MTEEVRHCLSAGKRLFLGNLEVVIAQLMYSCVVLQSYFWRIATLSLSTFSRAVRAHEKFKSKSNELFLNELLEPYVEAAHIKGPGEVGYHLDKTQTSRLLSGKQDVPNKLRRDLERFGIEDEVAHNFETFIEDCLESTCKNALVATVLTLPSDGPTGDECLRLKQAESEFPRFLARALLMAIRNPNVPTDGGILWRRGTGTLSWKVGDLFKLAHEGRDCPHNIVAIPVNTAFDVHVSRRFEATASSLVSDRTLHGKWITKMMTAGNTEEQLRQRIDTDLAARDIHKDSQGKFPIGTVAIIEQNDAVYYLLAISQFDEHNNAQSSKAIIDSAVVSLANFHDRYGQGADLYVPLIGTGLSRAGLTYKDSFDTLVKAFTNGNSHLTGKTTIVLSREAAQTLCLKE